MDEANHRPIDDRRQADPCLKPLATRRDLNPRSDALNGLFRRCRVRQSRGLRWLVRRAPLRDGARHFLRVRQTERRCPSATEPGRHGQRHRHLTARQQDVPGDDPSEVVMLRLDRPSFHRRAGVGSTSPRRTSPSTHPESQVRCPLGADPRGARLDAPRLDRTERLHRSRPVALPHPEQHPANGIQLDPPGSCGGSARRVQRSVPGPSCTTTGSSSTGTPERRRTPPLVVDSVALGVIGTVGCGLRVQAGRPGSRRHPVGFRHAPSLPT